MAHWLTNTFTIISLLVIEFFRDSQNVNTRGAETEYSELKSVENLKAGPSAAPFRQLPDTCRNGAALGPAYFKLRH